jgi:hypothetical protein
VLVHRVICTQHGTSLLGKEQFEYGNPKVSEFYICSTDQNQTSLNFSRIPVKLPLLYTVAKISH